MIVLDQGISKDVHLHYAMFEIILAIAKLFVTFARYYIGILCVRVLLFLFEIIR